MSKEPYIYKQTDGEEAFLAGIAEVYTEGFLGSALYKNYHFCPCVSLSCDVFSLEENNKLSINEAIKKRIRNHGFGVPADGEIIDFCSLEKAVDNMELKKLDIDFEEAVKYLLYIEVKDTSKIDDVISIYCRELEWYLGKAINVYELKDIKYLSLFDSYIYIVYYTIFIEFDEYVLMLNIGTDD